MKIPRIFSDRRNRSSVHIIADMLSILKSGPQKQTRLMMLTYLSPNIFYRYLSICKTKNLIRHEDGVLVITEEGKKAEEFLRSTLSQIQEFEALRNRKKKELQDFLKRLTDEVENGELPRLREKLTSSSS
jgi:predicted transcriptional regulator